MTDIIINTAEIREREYWRRFYAGMAMQGWIAALADRRGEDGYSDEAASTYAAHYGHQAADALIAEMFPEEDAT